MNGVPPRNRDRHGVPELALYAQKTVRENLSFGLKMHKVPKEQIVARVDEVAKLLALTDLLDRKPAQLSGGQRQRVAMGRALAREPEGVPAGRAALEPGRPAAHVAARRAEGDPQRFPTTSLYVTHDQVEAMTLATGSR